MEQPIVKTSGMPSELISFRTTKPGTLERADRLATHFEGRSDLQGLSVNRSRVLEMALLRGLDALEEQESITDKPKRGKK